MGSIRLLIVEDDPGLRQVLQIQLEREGYLAQSVASAEEALPILEKVPHDLVITDLNLPGASGIELLKRVRTVDPQTAVIVMTAFATVETAVQAMKEGAYDYITKPIHPYELKALIERAVDHNRLREQVEILRTCLDRKYGFEEIVGSSQSLLECLDIAARTASTDATVLIYGETGTGKELVAKAIHFLSNRRDAPFITINCGAIPRELLESELFGHVKGSFTGALAHKKGKVEMADGGTILLDEIGEMPLELQVRILRLIQEREIEKVGGMTPTRVNVRIIAATHRDLSTMVNQGAFREDLYYRLLVVPIHLPPLRERQGDVTELVQHFFLKFRAKYGRGELALPPEVVRRFEQYDWPGNVRQLENAIERVVLLSKGAAVSLQELPEFLRAEPASPKPPSLPDSSMGIQAVEKELILRTLKDCRGNQTRAAQILKMTRRALGYRLKRYGLQEADLKQLRRMAG
jgi:two-component system NtrC family response regulator